MTAAAERYLSAAAGNVHAAALAAAAASDDDIAAELVRELTPIGRHLLKGAVENLAEIVHEEIHR